MKNSTFYSRLSEKIAIYTHGFSYKVKTFDPNCSNYSKSSGLLYTTSDLEKLFTHPTAKRVHVNQCNAALCFDIKDGCWTRSEYYRLDSNCPDFIVRHIRFHKYLGEVEVMEINDNVIKVKTSQEVKHVVKSVFVKYAVNSSKECVSPEELERLQFNQRMENTDNTYTNHCSVL
jgi:hypothetical protein